MKRLKANKFVDYIVQNPKTKLWHPAMSIGPKAIYPDNKGYKTQAQAIQAANESDIAARGCHRAAMRNIGSVS